MKNYILAELQRVQNTLDKSIRLFTGSDARIFIQEVELQFPGWLYDPMNIYADSGVAYQYADMVAATDYLLEELRSENGTSHLYFIPKFGGSKLAARLSGIDSLKTILEECFMFEFTVVDDSFSGLVCENKHDMFCAIGKFERIVASMAELRL